MSSPVNSTLDPLPLLSDVRDLSYKVRLLVPWFHSWAVCHFLVDLTNPPTWLPLTVLNPSLSITPLSSSLENSGGILNPKKNLAPPFGDLWTSAPNPPHWHAQWRHETDGITPTWHLPGPDFALRLHPPTTTLCPYDYHHTPSLTLHTCKTYIKLLSWLS